MNDAGLGGNVSDYMAVAAGQYTVAMRQEVAILRLAAQGAPAMEIADELCLSVGAVRNYLSRVIGKTCARNRVDAIRIADGAGWL